MVTFQCYAHFVNVHENVKIVIFKMATNTQNIANLFEVATGIYSFTKMYGQQAGCISGTLCPGKF